MRSKLDGRIAGTGTTWAFYEDEETYKDNKVHVRLPYDFMTKEERESLNGEVITYNIKRPGGITK